MPATPAHRAGPKSAIGIAEDRNRDASSRPLCLPRRAKGLNKELRHVAPTPNPQPCDGHEGHRLNDLAARNGRTRHVSRSCDFSSLTSSAAHCRASLPVSRNARAFARALFSADRSAGDSFSNRAARAAADCCALLAVRNGQCGFSGR